MKNRAAAAAPQVRQWPVQLTWLGFMLLADAAGSVLSAILAAIHVDPNLDLTRRYDQVASLYLGGWCLLSLLVVLRVRQGPAAGRFWALLAGLLPLLLLAACYLRYAYY